MEKSSACVYRYFPFAIIIKDKDVRQMEDLPKQRTRLDPGAKRTGIAVVREIPVSLCPACRSGIVQSRLSGSWEQSDDLPQLRQPTTRYRRPE